MSTVSRDENWVLSSEDSSCPEESELELGLGLSLGGSGTVSKTCRGSRARILSHDGFPSSDVSSSSSFPSGTAGTKRSTDSVASAANGGGQAVGWPPVGAYRMNNLSNQAKPQATEKNKNGVVEKTIDDGHKNDGSAKEKGQRSSFVKVNMDGSAIGRKVDLKVHGCYETLAKTLEDMFLSPTTTITITRQSKLLDGSSGFALTYEDKDGDWMLVGDVPWRMFLESVKRLRIMRTTEANGLAPLRQRCKPVDTHFTR